MHRFSRATSFRVFNSERQHFRECEAQFLQEPLTGKSLCFRLLEITYQQLPLIFCFRNYISFYIYIGPLSESGPMMASMAALFLFLSFHLNAALGGSPDDKTNRHFFPVFKWCSFTYQGPLSEEVPSWRWPRGICPFAFIWIRHCQLFTRGSW